MEYNKIIEMEQDSENRMWFKYGEDYYKYENTAIKNRKKQVYIAKFGGAVDNPFAANHTIASGYFPMIVDQKVKYLLGNGVQFEEDQNLDNYFKHTFDNAVMDLATTASVKGQAWLLAFKEGGSLKFAEIPVEQLYPVFDESDNLILMIRRFDEGDKKVMLVYDDQEVKRYEKKKQDKEYTEVDRYGHYQSVKMHGGRVVSEEAHGFGRVPFIPLYNYQKRSDLHAIKSYIDTYDIINSDFANNIDDMQDAYFVLKGYSGDGKDLGEFMKELKQLKAVPVSEDGDITSHQLQIPTEARSVFLDRLDRDIFKFAMAVNTEKMAGAQLTATEIMSMYANLDLKCDGFESQIQLFVYELIDFINAVDNKAFDYNIRLDRSMIMNRAEQVQMLKDFVGQLSNRTKIELSPWDIDPDEEMARIEAEMGPIGLEIEEEEDNPVPGPNDGEERSAYVSRAMSFLIDEGYSEEQASAIAFKKWRDAM